MASRKISWKMFFLNFVISFGYLCRRSPQLHTNNLIHINSFVCFFVCGCCCFCWRVLYSQLMGRQACFSKWAVWVPPFYYGALCSPPSQKSRANQQCVCVNVLAYVCVCMHIFSAHTYVVAVVLFFVFSPFSIRHFRPPHLV